MEENSREKASFNLEHIDVLSMIDKLEKALSHSDQVQALLHVALSKSELNQSSVDYIIQLIDTNKLIQNTEIITPSKTLDIITAQFFLAIMYSNSGDLQSSEDFLDKLADQSHPAMLYFWSRLIQKHLANNRPQNLKKAEDLFAKIINSHKQNPFILASWTLLILQYLNASCLEAAQDLLNEAYAAYPNSGLVLTLWGIFYEKKRNAPTAIQYYIWALQKNRHNFDARTRLQFLRQDHIAPHKSNKKFEYSIAAEENNTITENELVRHTSAYTQLRRTFLTNQKSIDAYLSLLFNITLQRSFAWY